MISVSLAGTALLMGIAGAPHCAAMCGAACGGLTGGARPGRSRWLFQGGRLAGYATAGAVAAGAVQAFGSLTQYAVLLRPAWTLFHLAVLAWALLGGAATPVILAVPLVAWARVHLQRHTLAQTAAGVCLGATLLLVALLTQEFA